MEIVASGVFVKEGKVLLENRKVDENNYSGLWAFPGRHKKENESIKETLVREMQEELHVDVVESELIISVKDVDPTSKVEYEHFLFLCKKWEGTIEKTTEQKEIRWFDINEAKKMECKVKFANKVLNQI